MLENILRLFDPLRVVAMDGNQNAALSDSPVIANRFIFGDTHTDEGSHESSDSASGAHTGQRRHDRSRRDERAEARNRQRADANQEAQRTADDATRTCSRTGALRSLGALLVREVFGSLVVGKQNRNVLMPESGCKKCIDSLLDLHPIGIEAECCRILSCHMLVSSALRSTNRKSTRLNSSHLG